MDKNRFLGAQRQRRTFRVRKRLRGTAERPRLSVFRSNNNISCQIIDDSRGTTLVSASSLEPAVRSSLKYGGNREAATAVGKVLAQRAVEAGIQAVCFDRGPYKFHGRVAALANAARESGLNF